MSHDQLPDPADLLTQAFWDERYRSADQVWSGNPNLRLVEQVAGLPLGSALDIGCGEGADAIWLAAGGWQVTGVDVSTVALDRAARFAAQAGAEIAARITWQQADILTWTPPSGQFDLVSAHFIHLPTAERESLHRRLADAVRPGGSLLIVGHHPSDLDTSVHRFNMPDFFYTAEQVAATLEPDTWEIVEASAPKRQALDPDSQPITISDAVLRAVRRR
jgi:2-polyprenyl-3-methyl-5-hydroxy-6-metoxy-1,4-benzoquinol methylase